MSACEVMLELLRYQRNPVDGGREKRSTVVLGC